MKLNVPERLILLQIVPKEGNFLTLKVVRDLTSTLAMNDEEFKEFNILQGKSQPTPEEPEGKEVDPNTITWNLTGIEEREVEIGEKATDIIVEALKKLDENKKLEQRHLSLYEKFIGG